MNLTPSWEQRLSSARGITKGRPFPLGVTLDAAGANFAVFSQYAQGMTLLLFDRPDGLPIDIIPLEKRTKFIWHSHVGGVRAGQLYAYKAQGEFNAARGLRFNQHKLLLDPYAKALSGKVRNTENLLLAYDPNSSQKDLSVDSRENTAIMPKCIVVDDSFDWENDRSPNIPLEKLFIYETHVKGFTAHPSSGVRFPGTYLGFIERIPHLVDLGINAVELLPIHEYYVDDFLLNRGLTNYWGYNTIGFLAPESSYSTQSAPGCQVAEFKTLVRELHKAGIKVILDVVYNHTGEGNEMGPTISFRGLDNPNYYTLTGPRWDPLRYYMNYSGCGNTLNADSPAVIRLIMDSLRYWVEVMHVDGFRFDLASVLGRSSDGSWFRNGSSFFDVVSQDPFMNQVLLVAEPWDIGTYQVGNFPVDWSEWNGKFRDTSRKFGKGDAGQIPDLGYRLTGSADLYGDDGRSAFHSVNFITCHDGFTLHDLLAYNGKHNEANGEENRDGSNDNSSWNCGWEGETEDPAILELRKRLAKNYFCLLLFSSGTPMLLGGDEFLRTQGGNNNAYCQDNPISWFDWTRLEKNPDIYQFLKKTIAFTKRYTILQRRKFFLGEDLNDNNIPDFSWYGANLDKPDWQNPESRVIAFQLDGSEEQSEVGDYRLFVILNADFQVQGVKIPAISEGLAWYRVIDTSLPADADFLQPGEEVRLDPAEYYLANPRSTVVLLGKK